MPAAADLAPPTDLAGMVLRLHRLMDERPDCPSPDEIREACHTLYSASLLKEEGRPVRARVTLAPPETFDVAAGPPEGIHAVRFTRPHAFSANEIKRLSPAASFFHSMVAVWPDRDRGLRIWGLLNTGPRWMNRVAGGRKPHGHESSHPVIHVRDPGWLLFYQGYELLSEWRGREFHGPRLDCKYSAASASFPQQAPLPSSHGNSSATARTRNSTGWKRPSSSSPAFSPT